jgi:hypothetical protein
MVLKRQCNTGQPSQRYIVPLCFREENVIVPQVVKAVLSLPVTAHLAIRYTSIKLFGELCEWAEKHPDYLGKYIQVI